MTTEINDVLWLSRFLKDFCGRRDAGRASSKAYFRRTYRMVVTDDGGEFAVSLNDRQGPLIEMRYADGEACLKRCLASFDLRGVDSLDLGDVIGTLLMKHGLLTKTTRRKTA